MTGLPSDSPDRHTSTIPLADACLVLQQTPVTLDAWLRHLPAAWLDVDEGPNTWSPRQVLMHLAWGEVDDWLPRINTIVEHGPRQAFTPFDREEGFRRYGGRSVGELLTEFSRLRQESLDGLRRLAVTDSDMAREGRHPEFGAVTLGQLIATWVTHDLTHLTQIGRVLTRHAGAATGPWRAYFSLLRS